MNEQKKYEVIKKLVDTNGNKARSPVRTVSKQLRAQIALLYENKYFDANIRHFTELLAVLTPRKIDAGHCIRFRNKYYAPTDEQGCRVDFYKGTAAIVIRTLSGKLYVYAMAGKEEQSRLLIISLKCLCRERRLTMSCDMRGLSAGRKMRSLWGGEEEFWRLRRFLR